MNIIRKTQINKEQGGGAFTRGKKAIAICQRSGMKYLREEMVFEPGTNFIVHKSESDGSHSIIVDPLNYPSLKLQQLEGLGLKYTSPDVKLSVGTVVTPVSLGQTDGIMLNAHYAYPGTSTTTQE